jgi:hypothetical protein
MCSVVDKRLFPKAVEICAFVDKRHRWACSLDIAQERREQIAERVEPASTEARVH